ncbi:MAG: anaerobic ribonucleoside-triphosphate reductase [Kiritimatiellae bacterium]|nr:anaerobic ribonucleoside-triphosphate reductase [Kiritimatiellia bacterium]
MSNEKIQAEGFDGFRKRSGLVVPFRKGKIESAIQRAFDEVSREQKQPRREQSAAKMAELVIAQLTNPSSEYYVYPDEQDKRIPNIEDVQDLVEIIMAENGEALVVASYKRYRKAREMARGRIRVRGGNQNARIDVTDASLLLVESTTQNVTLPWDRQRIVKQIIDKTSLSVEEAINIAKSVENRIIGGEIPCVNSTLIRELVNNEIMERGFNGQLRDLSLYRLSRDYVESLMFSKSTENSNIVNNNPEAVNLGIAELVLKQWALDTIFSKDVKRAHDTGAVHLHDLGYPHRVYCSSHSIEYVKKFGLRGLSNLNTESHPARSASVLTGHLNTFLASMQANYAGALGIAYINILYAPYLEGMDFDALKQVAQELIFNGSQNAFSRGGQTLFLDFNIHTGVPRYMKKVPAIGPGGRYMLRRKDGVKVALTEELREQRDPSGYKMMDLYLEEAGSRRLVLREELADKGGVVFNHEVEAELAERGEAIVTYGDYQKETREFCRALLKVWSDGDRNGRVFEFPKCDFHVSDETFKDEEQFSIYMEACELASKNGSTYFIFDRDEVTLSACCRLRTTISDDRMLRHPECMRFCGFQNVTINIPQAAYRASRRGSEDIYKNFYEELDKTMELAVQAHLQKKNVIADMMSGPGRPLWQVGRESCDGKPYIKLDDCTYIIGLIGVNDAVNFLIGQELHENRDAAKLGLKIVAHMFLKIKKLAKKYNLKFTLEESPAESAARRLAKTDLVYFREEARNIVKGSDEDVVYYTNSIHLSADAPVSLVERIREQAKYHSMIESGAITHAFVGEERPSPKVIGQVMKEVFFRTQSAQVTISPEFTYCNDCNHVMNGLLETCTVCGSEDVVGETRVVGYFSKIQNWNKSKRYGELTARHNGRYSVVTVDSGQSPGETVTAAQPETIQSVKS